MPHAAPANAAPCGRASAICAAAVLDTPGDCMHPAPQFNTVDARQLRSFVQVAEVHRICNWQSSMRFCCQELCCHALSTAGSHLQREVLAAEDDTALLALVRRSARQQRYVAQRSCGEHGNRTQRTHTGLTLDEAISCVPCLSDAGSTRRRLLWPYNGCRI